MDDRQIIELYYRRDEKAILVTSQKYGEYCFSVANNILHSDQDSEECVNDAWLRTWNTIPPQNPACLRLFLAKITRNLAFNRFKEQNRQKRGGGVIIVALDEISDFLPSSDRVETQAEEEELIRAVNQFLRSISERDCNIFIHRYFYVETARMIADRYGLNESNVQKILLRTRNRLKRYLEAKGYTI